MIALFFIFITNAFALETVPDFNLSSMEGKTVSTSEVNKGVSVFYFWSTWCKCCKQSWGEIQDISKKHASHLSVHGVAVATTSDQVEDFAKKNEIPKKMIVMDDGKLMDRFHIHSIPTTFLVHKGKVIFQYEGPMHLRVDELEQKITQLIKDR